MAELVCLPHVGGLVRLSLGIMLLFVAFQEAQNSVPQVMHADGKGEAGDAAFSIYYAVHLPMLFAAPRLISAFGARVTLPFSGVFNCTFSISMLLFAAGALGSSRAAAAIPELGAAVGGSLASCLWPSQGVLLTSWAPEALLNRYTAFFTFCFCASGFVGPAISSAVLAWGGERAMACALAAIGLVGLMLLVALPPAEPRVEPNGEKGAEQPRLRGDRRAWHLGALAFAEGVCLNAFVPVALPALVAAWGVRGASEDDEERRLQLALLFNGLGHLGAGLAYAPIADNFGRRCVLLLQFWLCGLVILLSCLQWYMGAAGTGSVPLVLPAAFLGGLATVLTRTGTNILTSSLFPSRSRVAFTVLAFARLAASSLGFLVLPSVSPLACVVGPLALLALASLAAWAHRPLFGLEGRDAAEQPQERRSIVLMSQYPVWIEPLLQAFAQAGYRVSAVVSANPIAEGLCAQHGVRFVLFPKCPDGLSFAKVCREDPEYHAAAEAAFEVVRAVSPDVIFACGFYILPPHVTRIPRCHALNMHPAELPSYRGGVPLQAAILNGEPHFRAVVHRMTDMVDDPSAVLSRSCPLPVGPESSTTAMIGQVASCLPELVMDALGRCDRNSDTSAAPPPLLVPHAFGTRTERFTDPVTGEQIASNAGVMARARIEWELDGAEAVARAVRAFRDTVGAYTDYQGRAWKIEACGVAPPRAADSAPPGTVLAVESLGGGRCRVTAPACDGPDVVLVGSFAAADEAPPAIAVGARFSSTTPVSQWIGQRGADWRPGGTRYGVSRR